MTSTSFENFTADIQKRSYYCHDWISECLAELDEDISGELTKIPEARCKALKSVFELMERTIRRDVRLSSVNGDAAPETVFFHPRYGWIVEAGDRKAFLGKITLLEKTRVSIGHRSYFSGPSVIRGGGEVTIGAFCSIAEGAFINSFRDFHPMSHASTVNFRENSRLRDDGLGLEIDYPEFESSRNRVSIGNDVWIGRNARIFFDTSIEDGCVIAERSLVRSNCRAFGIYAGTPAKLIRYRLPDSVRKQLSDCRWWNWSDERIKRNRDFFATLLTDFDGKIENLIK